MCHRFRWQIYTDNPSNLLTTWHLYASKMEWLCIITALCYPLVKGKPLCLASHFPGRTVASQRSWADWCFFGGRNHSTNLSRKRSRMDTRIQPKVSNNNSSNNNKIQWNCSWFIGSILFSTEKLHHSSLQVLWNYPNHPQLCCWPVPPGSGGVRKWICAAAL